MAQAKAISLTTEPPAGPAAGPSAFYRAGLWRVGLAAARALPLPVCLGLGRLVGGLYGALQPARRRVVTENLLPLLGGDYALAQRTARRLFRNFGEKLADLMRFEAGLPVEGRFVSLNEWGRFEAARARGKGVLLLTPHLGNWEIGGPLLVSRGVPLMVVTQAEPGNDFTQLRSQARARWGIETLEIGQDAFAFVKILQRLQGGATVAMLVDRPPGPSGVEVRFCGRPFQASVAPAELARAAGCALLGVYIVARGGGYAAHVLPEFVPDRRALGSRSGRCELAGRIMQAFEPVIRAHADQWYHFVPIWPGGGERGGAA